MCAGGKEGVVAVWNLEDKGVLDVRRQNIGGKSLYVSAHDRSIAPKPAIKVSNFLHSILGRLSLSLLPLHCIPIMK